MDARDRELGSRSPRYNILQVLDDGIGRVHLGTAIAETVGIGSKKFRGFSGDGL